MKKTKKIIFLVLFGFGYSYLFLNMYGTLKQKATSIFKFISTPKPQSISLKPINLNPYENRSASLRLSSSISEEEKELINKRLEVCSNNLSKRLNLQLTTKTTPRIAICSSGGSFRATLSSYGIHKGLAKIGLLDSCLYSAGISGATWFMFPWLWRGKNIYEYESLLVDQLTTDLKHTLLNTNQITLALAKKRSFGQPISLVDVAGACLGIKFFSQMSIAGLSCYMSDIKFKLKDGSYPFPIGSAIMPTHDKEFEWFEFTPIEIGCEKFNSYVPTWAFGRKFENGHSLDFSPEQTLSYMLAIFGSAYEANLYDLNRLLNELRDVQPQKEDKFNKFKSYILKHLNFAKEKIASSTFGDIRISPAKINNFLYKLYNPYNNELYDRNFINLIDAGISINIPFQPLLRKERNIDIIIVCDASLFIKNELSRSIAYAKKENLNFPKINICDLDEVTRKDDNSILIFKDEENPDAPTLIYVPIIPDTQIAKKHFGTFKTRYTPEESKRLISIAEEKILQNENQILQVIKDVTLGKLQNSNL